MNILFIGGTRFFGIHAIHDLLAKGHNVTIANRGKTKDDFGDRVERIIVDRTDEASVNQAFAGKYFDVVVDNVAYASNDLDKVLKVVGFGKYIHTSTMFVYENLHLNTLENEFDGSSYPLVFSDRGDFIYDETKRHAEALLCQNYGDKNWVAVRFPYVSATNDYSKRILFYVENTMNGTPMFIDNLDEQLGFIRCDEAGKFLSFMVDTDFTGVINASSHGSISVGEILDYVEKKTGSKAVLSADGVEAPYNGTPAYTINTDLAESLGFEFLDLNDWIFDLLDHYIDLVSNTK